MIIKKNIKLIEKKINYIFKNKTNLINSLTHPSFYKERNKNINDNFKINSKRGTSYIKCG